MQRRPKRNSCKHLQGHSVHCSTFCICQSEPTSLGRTFLYFQANLQYSWKTRIATSRWASGLLWQDQELFWKYLSRGRPARRLWCPQVSRLMATPCSWPWSATRQLTLESMWMDIGKPTSQRSAKTFCRILMSSYHQKARTILSFWMLKQGKIHNLSSFIITRYGGQKALILYRTRHQKTVPLPMAKDHTSPHFFLPFPYILSYFRMIMKDGIMGWLYPGRSTGLGAAMEYVGTSKAQHVSKFVEFYKSVSDTYMFSTWQGLFCATEMTVPS